MNHWADQYDDEGEEEEEEDWQPDSYYRIEEVDAPSEIYTFIGRGGPASSSAVSKAKKKYAEDNDVDFRRLTGKKIGSVHGHHKGAIVMVVEKPEFHASRTD